MYGLEVIDVRASSGEKAYHRRLRFDGSDPRNRIERVDVSDLSRLRKARSFNKVEILNLEIPHGKDVRWLQERMLGVEQKKEFPYHFALQETKGGAWEIVQVTPLQYQFEGNDGSIRIAVLENPKRSAEGLPSERQIEKLGSLLDGLGKEDSAMRKEIKDSDITLNIREVQDDLNAVNRKFSPFLATLRDRSFTQRSYKTGSP